MKLALIGRDISHSLSPQLYKRIIQQDLIYDLLDYDDERKLPSLELLAKKYNGINITSPYKSHYLNQVLIHDKNIRSLGAINTIALTKNGYLATNTDLIAVRFILTELKNKYPKLHLILLGNGVMARLSLLVASELDLSVMQFSRSTHENLSDIDLRPFEKQNHQTVIISACSRNFQFTGNISSDSIFWDYNYSFIPHQSTLPLKVKEYHDGQEMLYLQAKEAWKFWQTNIH